MITRSPAMRINPSASGRPSGPQGTLKYFIYPGYRAKYFSKIRVIWTGVSRTSARTLNLFPACLSEAVRPLRRFRHQVRSCILITDRIPSTFTTLIGVLMLLPVLIPVTVITAKLFPSKGCKGEFMRDFIKKLESG